MDLSPKGDLIISPTDLIRKIEPLFVAFATIAWSHFSLFRLKDEDDVTKVKNFALFAEEISSSLFDVLHLLTLDGTIPVYAKSRVNYDKTQYPLKTGDNPEFFYAASNIRLALKSLLEVEIKNSQILNSFAVDEVTQTVLLTLSVAIQQCFPILAEDLIICNEYEPEGGTGPTKPNDGGKPRSRVMTNWQCDIVAGWIPDENLIGRQSYKNRGPLI